MTPSVRMWLASVALLGVAVFAPQRSEDRLDSPQASIRPGGFALTGAYGADREVLEFDRGGNPKRRVAFPLPTETRVVGLKAATGLVWLRGKVHIAAIQENGQLTKPTIFGTNPKLLCTGAASGPDRFAVGWIEGDGEFWFVHGPGPGVKTAGEEIEVTAAAPATTWCTMTTAGKQLALFARQGDALVHNVCDRRCGMLSKLEIDLKNRDVLGAGCVDGACAVASGGDAAPATIGWFARSGKRKWTKELPEAKRGAHAALIGTTKHVVVAYEREGGLVILKVGATGQLNELWRGRGTLPTLSWVNGSLFLGYRDKGGALGTIVLAVAN